MASTHITEICPTGKWPKWATDAFAEGQFFHTAVTKVTAMERRIRILEGRNRGCRIRGDILQKRLDEAKAEIKALQEAHAPEYPFKQKDITNGP